MRFAVALRHPIPCRRRDYSASRGQVTMTDEERELRKEHIWLIALYDMEERAEELLARLSAIGVDTSEATTLRVEIDERERATKFHPATGALPLSLTVRNSITGALTGATLALLIGISLYSSGLLNM